MWPEGSDWEQLEYEDSLEPYIDPQTIAEEVRDEILREYEAGGGS